MTSKEYQSFYEALFSRKIPPGLTLEEFRATFEERLSAFPPPEEVRFEKFTIGSIPACWALAPGATRQHIILFFFGGGYSSGSIQSHKGLIGRLAAASKYPILAIDYRLAPENPFPSALEDALAAYQWLLHHPYPPSHIALAGISAGGGLALSLLLRLKLEKKSLPQAAVCFSPWIDLALKGTSIRTNNGKDLLNPERLAFYAENYASGKDLNDPFISPLYGDLHRFPPLFIQTGTRDLLHDESIQLAEKAKKSGVEAVLDVWPDMIHAWQLYDPAFPESQEATQKAVDFLIRAFQRPR